MNSVAVRCAVFTAACVALCFVAAPSKAEESADGLWALRASNAAPSAGMQAWAVPKTHRSAQLNTTALDAQLATAAVEGPNVDVPTHGAEITLPLPDGTFQRFAVVETRMLSAALQAANPGIATYRGVGLDDSEAIVACTRSALGFHCMILKPDGTVHIDPLWRGNEEMHAVYDRGVNMQGKSFRCECEETAAGLADRDGGLSGASGLVTIGDTRRQFRLAVAVPGEYWQFFGSDSATSTAVTVTMNFVNTVLERDVGVRLVLTHLVMWTDPTTDPYSDPPGGRGPEIQPDLDANVPGGNAGYDIGHLFDTYGNGQSGSACVGCICNASNKGGGRSNGGPDPVPSQMQVIVLHELGHQLGARHTWTGCAGQTPNWDSNASVEPGSGSTVMSYAGHCAAADEVLGGFYAHRYFHADSIERIVAVTSATACGIDVATGNSAPSVSAGPDITIPARTPFWLVAGSSDPDGDDLSYCWEQMDVSPVSYPYGQVDTGDNPLFRSQRPAPRQTRFFPRLDDLLVGDLYPGTLGEQLPSTNRTMEFWVTARDGATGVDQDSMTVTVDASTGPFRVLSPNGGESISVDVPFEITWDPAGTAGGSVNVADVNIALFVDWGVTFVGFLATSTPNDGSHTVTFDCSALSTTARIRVAANIPGSHHAWFDVSDNNFEIVDLTPPTVDCTMARGLLWPPRNGMLPAGLNWSQLPDNCGAAVTRTLSIYSTQADGVAPFSPDWSFTAPVDLRLRAERAYPGPGRIYLVVVSATDSSGNRGVDCCTTVVPTYPRGSHIIALRGTAAAAEAFCLASPTDVAPPGFVPLVTGVPLP